MGDREEAMAQREAELERVLKELEETRRTLAARTAIAWMGLTSSAWRHNIEGCAASIREATLLIREQLKAGPMVDETAIERLMAIDELARKILSRPILPPLPPESEVPIVCVNELVRERIAQLWLYEPYRSHIKQVWELDSDAASAALVDPGWFREVVDILAQNAVEAMTESPEGILTIRTKALGDKLEIHFSDTGCGISPEVLPRILKEPLRRSSSEGKSGFGLLIAEMIVQAYGGDLRLASTSPKGTTLVMRLPRA